MGLPEAVDSDSPFTKPRRHRPRGSKILMVLGALMVVVGVVLAQQGSRGFRAAANDIRNSGDDVRNSLLVQVAVPGTDVVDLEPGRYDVFAVYGLGAATTTSGATTPSTSPAPTAPTSSAPTSSAPTSTDPDRTGPTNPDEDLPQVTVIDPDGRRVGTVEPSVEALYSGAFGQLEAIESFTATMAGSYRIEVRGDGAHNGAVQEVGIGPSLDDGDVGRLLTGGLVALVGYLGAAVGFVLAAGGGIWYLASSDPPPPGSGPGGYPTRPGPAGWTSGPPMAGGSVPAPWGPPPAPHGPPGWAPPPATGPRPDRRPPPPAPPPPPGR